MSEQEREEIVRQMAVAIRKQKFTRTKRINCFDETNITEDELSEARAALAVAEPVIREQADNALREENARLREALKPFAGILKGNYSHQSDDMPIKAGANQYDLVFVFTLGDLRAAAAAIREGGKE